MKAFAILLGLAGLLLLFTRMQAGTVSKLLKAARLLVLMTLLIGGGGAWLVTSNREGRQPGRPLPGTLNERTHEEILKSAETLTERLRAIQKTKQPQKP